jgi:hypothetical protein
LACGSVAHVTVPGSIERTLERAMASIEADAGFATDQHRPDLLGRGAPGQRST